MVELASLHGPEGGIFPGLTLKLSSLVSPLHVQALSSMPAKAGVGEMVKADYPELQLKKMLIKWFQKSLCQALYRTVISFLMTGLLLLISYFFPSQC